MDKLEKKLYDAILDFLSETMDKDEAQNQSLNIMSAIIELNNKLNNMINNGEDDTSLVAKKFHTLKNLLLYGDFYYESDLCQDIEEKLRETNSISSIIDLNNELQKSLSM